MHKFRYLIDAFILVIGFIFAMQGNTAMAVAALIVVNLSKLNTDTAKILQCKD